MKIKLNDKWTIKTAKELYTYTSGISKGSQFFGTGYPYLTFTEIFHNYFVPDELTSLVQSNDRERENCSIKRGDVFLTRTSETDNELGMSCVALKDYPNATFNGFTKRLRPLTDDVIPEYAGFYFRSPIFRAAVTSMSSIITRASLNEKMLDKLPVCYPSKKAQQKIASILSAYDNLIQNYKKQIEALQTAANELYKEWFVRFRFPGYQTAKFETGIPKGWKVEKLTKLVEVKYGKDHSKLDVGNIPVYGSGGIMRYCNKALYDKETVLIPRKGSLNNIMYANNPLWTVDTMFYTVMLRKNIAKYLYYVLSKIDMESFNAGAALPSMTTEILSHFKIIVPDSEILESFDKKIALIFTQIDNLQQQITNLTQQRDLLLPRLMSGKLGVE